jgi:very-short-patch-repair endonuclease
MPPKKSPPVTYQHAHDLRYNSTEAEANLWTYLRSHRLRNVHFRRQHPIGKYIVDFCAPRQKLIIELDGSQHLDQEDQDMERTSFLASKGYRVIRFWNHEVSNHLDGVIMVIEQALVD